MGNNKVDWTPLEYFKNTKDTIFLLYKNRKQIRCSLSQDKRLGSIKRWQNEERIKGN